MRELARDLLGKVELVVRALKDFQASSVLLVERDVWSADSRSSGAGLWRGLGDVGCGGRGDEGVGLREKSDGWRKE